MVCMALIPLIGNLCFYTPCTFSAAPISAEFYNDKSLSSTVIFGLNLITLPLFFVYIKQCFVSVAKKHCLNVLYNNLYNKSISKRYLFIYKYNIVIFVSQHLT